MHTIQVSVRDKIATQTDGTVVINGNSDYSIEFDFDAEWADLNNKIGIFAYNDAAAHKWAYQPVMFSGNTCTVPILRDIHCVYVGVTAGNVRVTTPAKVQCRLSISDYADTEEPPSADIWGQILEKLDELQAEIDEIKAGGVGGTPDWAQNDPNGAGYIKNRCGGYDDVQTKESELLSLNCPADENSAGTLAPPSFFPPSAGDIISVTVDGITKEYTLAEETVDGNSVLWFGTQNPSSVTDIDAFFASDKWYGAFGINGSGTNLSIGILYGSLSEIAGKTVGLKQRCLVSVPVKISRKYLDVDETVIKTTAKGALYRASVTDGVDTLGENATNLGVQAGAKGKLSLSAGNNTKAKGAYSAAFGESTESGGIASAAFGKNTKTTGLYATAFGTSTKATGKQSVAFGESTEASNESAVAFGYNTKATGAYSAAFGYLSTASNENAVAFGNRVKASGVCSAAFGYGTKAVKQTQFVCGLNNEEDTANRYRFIVGIGTANASKNGFAVTTKGEIVLPDPTATPTRYMKARFNSDGTITLIPLADGTKSYTTECTANRVTAITAESTDAQYPTAKAVYDALQDINIPSGTDISLNVTGATVGQTIKVKAVDADGKPTAWEAVDMAAGDTEVWEKVCQVTTTEDVSFIYQPFDGYYKKIRAIFLGESTTAYTVWVYPNTETRPSGADIAYIFNAPYANAGKYTIVGEFSSSPYPAHDSSDNWYRGRCSVARERKPQGLHAGWGDSLFDNYVNNTYAKDIAQGVKSLYWTHNAGEIKAGAQMVVYGVKA